MREAILIVEDDPYLSQGLTELMEKSGYCPTSADSISSAREALKQQRWDLVILDVTLPDGNGVQFCQSLRQEGCRTPILFLTARDEEFDIVRGLDAGGNDYVTKPFRIQELLSRIRVLLRKDPGTPWQVGTLEIDRQKMTVSKDGTLLSLTPTEFRLLLSLLEQRGVVTRDVLLGALWDCGGKYVDDNTLSVHMSRLREKIGKEHIITLRGVGYQWKD
mgnify:CR=1 FL=1